MVPLLLVSDLLVLGLVLGAWTAAAAAGIAVAGAAVHAGLPIAVGVAAGLLGAVAGLVVAVGTAAHLVPAPRPGRFQVGRGAGFLRWYLHYALRRQLLMPGIKHVCFCAYALRWLWFRAQRGRVAFDANLSSDVDVVDPAVTTIGAGAMLGAKVFVVGHMVLGKKLAIEPVVIAAGAQIGSHVFIGPGATVGEGAQVHHGVVVGPRVTVARGAIIEALARLDLGVEVGEGAVVGRGAWVPAGAVVAAGARYPGVDETRTSAAPAV